MRYRYARGDEGGLGDAQKNVKPRGGRDIRSEENNNNTSDHKGAERSKMFTDS